MTLDRLKNMLRRQIDRYDQRVKQLMAESKELYIR